MILSSMTQNSVNNILYYELIAVEFLKSIQKFNLKRFANCYFWISMGGVSSKPLILSALK